MSKPEQTDAAILRVLADWFEATTVASGKLPEELPQNLRRIAAETERRRPPVKVTTSLISIGTLVSVLIWAYARCVFSTGLDDSDRDTWHRSGATVVTDHRTGLQYLSMWGGITPRLDRDGRQLVSKESKGPQ